MIPSCVKGLLHDLRVVASRQHFATLLRSGASLPESEYLITLNCQPLAGAFAIFQEAHAPPIRPTRAKLSGVAHNLLYVLAVLSGFFSSQPKDYS